MDKFIKGSSPIFFCVSAFFVLKVFLQRRSPVELPVFMFLGFTDQGHESFHFLIICSFLVSQEQHELFVGVFSKDI